MEESVQFSGVDEEFRSCFGEDEDWQDAEEFSFGGQLEGNEEVSLKISEGNKEEGDSSISRNSEMLHGDDSDNGEDVVESIIFCNGLEEIVSECSLILHEGIDPEQIPECSLNLPEDHDEIVSDCSLRLLEGSEEITSMCFLMLYEDHGDDGSSEGGEEATLNFTRLESSLRLLECHEEDVSVCSLRLSGDDDDVISECSLIFSEDHENDILECPMRLSETHDKDDDDDGVLVRIFSKGVSFSDDGDLGSRTSGIGVVLEKPQGVTFLQVQKKLDFFVDEIVAELLALMDGLLEALKNDCRKVLAFTDSDNVYRVITKSDVVEDQLLIALQERIQELTDKFESFVMRQAPRAELKWPLQLAREATGAFSDLIECSTCGEDKPHSQMIEMHCSHRFCFDCMFIYVESLVRNPRSPVKCPHERCALYISDGICRSFLRSSSFESLEDAPLEMEAQNLWRFYCPFPDCSMLINAHHRSPLRQTTLVQPSIYCVECPGCGRNVCARCQVPWHSSMRCEEYQNLPIEERNDGVIASNQLVQFNSRRRCQQCRQLSELSESCDQCAHEYCFSCGAEYRHRTRTCRCEILDENSESSPASSEHETELSRWDWFNLLPGSIEEGYTEQEKTQLALIQRFLAGGIGFDSPNPYQSPPRSTDSYLDTFKDLNQLPWLESFISVIGDSYQENNIYR